MQDSTGDQNNISSLTVSIPQEIKEALELEAKRQDRSLASLVRIVMREFLATKQEDQNNGLINA
jgi:predicted HicB family RNase H-like nuclease